MKPKCKIKILAFLSGLFLLSACSLRTTPQSLREELHELKSKSKQNSAQELVHKGEQAMQIFDQAAYLDAEELAQAGLESLGFEALDEGLSFFEMALEKDRGNEKALFYLSLWRPLRPLKGLYWRLENLGDQNWIMQKYVFQNFSFLDKNEDGFLRFINFPYKERIKSQRDGVELIIKPFLEELLASEKGFTTLLSNKDFDFMMVNSSFFPVPLGDTRVRLGDLKMLRNFYRVLYIEIRFLMSYSLSSISPTLEKLSSSKDRVEINISDPSYGLLFDPHFFQWTKSDLLEVLDSVEMAYADLKRRFVMAENDPKDLIQANARSFLLCRSDWAFDAPVILPSSDSTKTCQISTSATTPIMLTLRGDGDRNFYDSTYDRKLIAREEELARFLALMDSSDFNGTLENMATMRKALLVPIEFNANCRDEQGNNVKEKIWLDYPGFAEHPISDLKTLAPRFVGEYETNNIYFLTDPTVNGLFKPHFPCYEHNRARARAAGVLEK